MNQDSKIPDYLSPDQWEARLTALLLGELSAAESEAASQAMAKDPQLAALGERLKQTIALIRLEAACPPEPAVPIPAPAQMSEERRQDLLAKFKVIPLPGAGSQPANNASWYFTLVLAASLVALLTIVSVVTHSWFSQSSPSLASAAPSLASAATLATPPGGVPPQFFGEAKDKGVDWADINSAHNTTLSLARQAPQRPAQANRGNDPRLVTQGLSRDRQRAAVTDEITTTSGNGDQKPVGSRENRSVIYLGQATENAQPAVPDNNAPAETAAAEARTTSGSPGSDAAPEAEAASPTKGLGLAGKPGQNRVDSSAGGVPASTAPTSPATADSSRLQTPGEVGSAADQERALKLPDSRGFGGYYQAGPAGGLPGGMGGMMGGMGGGGFGGGRAGEKPAAKKDPSELLAEGIPAENLAVQKTTGQENFGVEAAKADVKPATSLGFQFQTSQGNPTPVELPPRIEEPVTLVESHLNLLEARAKAKPAPNFTDASWKTDAKAEAEMSVVGGAVKLFAGSGLALDHNTGLPLANQPVEKNQANPGLLSGPVVATASTKPADGEPVQTPVLGDTPMLGRLFRSEARKSLADTPIPPAGLAGEAAGKEVEVFSRQSEGRITKGVETLRPEPAATPAAIGETRARFAARAGLEKKLAAMDSREVRRGRQESKQAGDAVTTFREEPAKPPGPIGGPNVLYDFDGEGVVNENGRADTPLRADPNPLISGLENAGSLAAAPVAGNGDTHQYFYALKDAKAQPAREAVALDFNGSAGNIGKLSGSLDGSVIVNGLIATNPEAAEFTEPAAVAQLMKANQIQHGKDLPIERYKQDAKASQPAPPAGAPAATEEGKQEEVSTRRNRSTMTPTMMQRYGLLTAPPAPALAAPASGPAARPEIGLQGGSSPAPQNQPAAMPLPALESAEPPTTDPAAKTRGPAPVPQPEIQTTENAFSTFSLNVADVSFKLAMTSLNQNTLPDPASVRSEEFVNAFQYRDPEPAPGSSLAFAWERARYPFAHDRELLRLSLRTAAQGREPGRPLNLVLLLDNSGSMERADRVRIIQECLQVLAAQLKPTDRISVVTFARTAHLLLDGLPGNQAGQIAGRVSQLTPGGGTNLEEALNLAYATARRHFLEQGVNRVVMLTDGAANLGNVNPQALKNVVEAQRRAGIALDCFGIGWEGYNDDLLENLSRNGDGRYGFVNDSSEAATGFAGQLAGALQVAASDVKVQVEFNPRRVTAYRQIGYAKHQLKKEQFRDNTVDAAELGAAETGNALYVLQVNPRGEGNLGTVRARYKIPGTSEYRENQWPLPCSGTTPALETASPALRLAATAAAFSEWLVSSPFAAEVTPDKLLALLQGVPAAFEPNKRPGQLEWMIRQARAIGNR